VAGNREACTCRFFRPAVDEDDLCAWVGGNGLLQLAGAPSARLVGDNLQLWRRPVGEGEVGIHVLFGKRIEAGVVLQLNCVHVLLYNIVLSVRGL
jgi:hypothetical protein